MLDFQQKRRVKKILYSKFSLFVLLIIFIFLFRAAFNSYRNEKETRVNLQKVEEKIADLNTRKSDLDSKISKLETETGIEEELRAKFNIVKEGEKIAMILEEKEEAVYIEPVKKGFWTKIGTFFRELVTPENN